MMLKKKYVIIEKAFTSYFYYLKIEIKFLDQQFKFLSAISMTIIWCLERLTLDQLLRPVQNKCWTIMRFLKITRTTPSCYAYSEMMLKNLSTPKSDAVLIPTFLHTTIEKI